MGKHNIHDNPFSLASHTTKWARRQTLCMGYIIALRGESVKYFVRAMIAGCCGQKLRFSTIPSEAVVNFFDKARFFCFAGVLLGAKLSNKSAFSSKMGSTYIRNIALSKKLTIIIGEIMLHRNI